MGGNIGGELSGANCPWGELSDIQLVMVDCLWVRSFMHKLVVIMNCFPDMAPLYEEVCAELKWPVDKKLLTNMKEKNEEKLKYLNDAIKDAEENLGETEIRDALFARAEYLCGIGDKVCVDRKISKKSKQMVYCAYDASNKGLNSRKIEDLTN